MKEPIRVLQVVTQMNRAGMESRLMDLYRNIDRNKVQFDFYTCKQDKGKFDDEILEMGGVIYYNSTLSLKNISKISSRFKEFLLANSQYKIVHCHLNQWSGLVLKGAKLAGVPVRIAHSRTSLDKFNLKNGIKNIIKLPVNKYATHKFAVSKKAGRWLFGEQQLQYGNIQVIPNSIDVKLYKFNQNIRNSTRAALNLKDKFVLIHVGNLRPEKNHKFLLNIFSEIKKHNVKSSLILIGADNMGGIVQEYAEKLGLKDDVYFMGSRNDVNELLQAGDLFIFPSIYEGFPGAILEAQASGLPALISDVITEEVVLLDSTVQLSLNMPAFDWANIALQMNPNNRIEAYRKIISAGYDVKQTAENLTEFYLDLEVVT